MNYANLIAGVSALHHINQEPQITLIRATLDVRFIRRLRISLRRTLRAMKKSTYH